MSALNTRAAEPAPAAGHPRVKVIAAKAGVVQQILGALAASHIAVHVLVAASAAIEAGAFFARGHEIISQASAGANDQAPSS
ncbi:MAG: hypothetical protein AAFX54_13015 [Pseudomonadota bacterium]